MLCVAIHLHLSAVGSGCPPSLIDVRMDVRRTQCEDMTIVIRLAWPQTCAESRSSESLATLRNPTDNCCEADVCRIARQTEKYKAVAEGFWTNIETRAFCSYKHRTTNFRNSRLKRPTKNLISSNRHPKCFPYCRCRCNRLKDRLLVLSLSLLAWLTSLNNYI